MSGVKCMSMDVHRGAIDRTDNFRFGRLDHHLVHPQEGCCASGSTGSQP